MTAPERGEKDSLWLAERAAEGDSGAVEALLERYLPDLRAFVRLRAGAALRERESASDLVQSTCREILTKQDRFRFATEGAFRSWLLTTAHRKIADRADHYATLKRGHAREQAIARESGADDERLMASYQRFSSPSHRALVQDEVDRIERAFDQLTQEQREIVTLAHIAGLSRREIAEQVGKSENAVRIVLHRALARLAEIVKGGDPA
jgi:RNA polymerase sigma-70 factor (ECF subfamily)